MKAIEHQPKAGLCMVCAKQCDDCSALPFASMPPLGAYQENGATVTIVRCTEFARINVVFRGGAEVQDESAAVIPSPAKQG